MSNVQHRICANCKHWTWFDVDYGDYPEDDCGSCKVCGEVMYGDEPACDDFDMSDGGNEFMVAKKPKQHKASKKIKKMRMIEEDYQK